MHLSTQIKNRLKLLLILFKAQDIIGIIVAGTLLSLFFFKKIR